MGATHGFRVLAEYFRCPVCNDRPEVEIWHDALEGGCPKAETAPKGEAAKEVAGKIIREGQG